MMGSGYNLDYPTCPSCGVDTLDPCPRCGLCANCCLMNPQCDSPVFDEICDYEGDDDNE